MEQHDRKIIRGLTLCSDPLQKGCVYETCPYEGKDCITRITGDALDEIRRLRRERAELMKKQEAKPVKIVKNAYNYEFYYCPNCDRQFYDFYKKPVYCDRCGQAVKWE